MTQNPLVQTLRLLQDLPDDRVSEWGLEYDWTAPVISAVVIGENKNTVWDRIESAMDILIDFGDARLTHLLLRPDIFNSPFLDASPDTSSARKKTSEQGFNMGIRSNLWAGALCRACANGDMELIGRVSQYAGKHIGQVVGSTLVQGMSKAINFTPEAKKEQVVRWLLDETINPHFGGGNGFLEQKSKRSTFICELIFNAEGTKKADSLLKILGNDLPSLALTDLTNGSWRRIDNRRSATAMAFRLFQAAAKVGGFKDQNGQGKLRYLNKDNRAESATAMECMCDLLVHQGCSETTFNTYALKLIDFEGAPGVPALTTNEVADKLATAGMLWDDKLLAKIREKAPEPSLREMVKLFLRGSDSIVAKRLPDFLDQAQTPAIEQFIESISNSWTNNAIGQERLFHRCGELLLLLDPDMSDKLDYVVRNHLNNITKVGGRLEIEADYEQFVLNKRTAGVTGPSRKGMRL